MPHSATIDFPRDTLSKTALLPFFSSARRRKKQKPADRLPATSCDRRAHEPATCPPETYFPLGLRREAALRRPVRRHRRTCSLPHANWGGRIREKLALALQPLTADSGLGESASSSPRRPSREDGEVRDGQAEEREDSYQPEGSRSGRRGRA